MANTVYYGNKPQYAAQRQGMWSNIAQGLISSLTQARGMREQKTQQEMANKLQQQQQEITNEFKQQQLDISERNVAAYEKQAGRERQKTPKIQLVEFFQSQNPNLSATDAYNIVEGKKSLKQLEEEAFATTSGRVRATPQIAKAPSLYDKKGQAVINQFLSGDIDMETFRRSWDKHTGIERGEDPSGRIGDVARGGNRKVVESIFLDKDGNLMYETKKIQNMIVENEGNPPIGPDGFRMDMPMEYNIAIENIKDKVPRDSDIPLVQKYDAMFMLFNDARKAGVTNYNLFKDWAKDMGFDISEVSVSQMKKWFGYYFKRGRKPIY